jgi:class 3 adenylate cyclase
VADVRSIVRRVAREHDGRVVDVRADETFFVFTDAEGALGTAIGMQRATLERQWPDDERVRLRIGLHRGRPSLSDGGYVGLAVNTAARVCAAGHGGQILATASVRDVVRTDVHGARFRPLGEHRLRGIPDGLELFDVEVDGLPTGFPPPREGALSRPR